MNAAPRHLRATQLVIALIALVLTDPAFAASVGMLGVEVVNKSEPQLCAEKDNVTLELRNPAVTQFRIEAAHPAFIDTLQRDSFAADWTACDIKPDPGTAGSAAPKPPAKVTIYEDVELWVTGYNFGGFWRDKVCSRWAATSSSRPNETPRGW